MQKTEVEPTDDLNQAKKDLEEFGLALLKEGMSQEETVLVRQKLFQAIESSEELGVPTSGYEFDPDRNNRRVFGMFNLDDIFVDLVQRPIALEFVRFLIGDSFLISNFSANVTLPGNQPMQLHADQGYVVSPWPDTPLACNVAWLLDDFTQLNGCTRYVPGSHKIGHGPDPKESYSTLPIEAPAGALLVMDGRLWHQTGSNKTTSESRAALFGYYVLRWIRPQINWNVTLAPERVAQFDNRFLHLLGYFTGNTEYQIVPGDGVAIDIPRELVESNTDFVLGNKADSKTDKGMPSH